MNAYVAHDDFVLDADVAASARVGNTFHPPRSRTGLMARLASAWQRIAELPRRRAVLNELEGLSDHELADIGLSRTELSRVFDPDFAASRAAN